LEVTSPGTAVFTRWPSYLS